MATTCPSCSNKLTFLSLIKLFTVSKYTKCTHCETLVKIKKNIWILIFDLVFYGFLFLIGIMLFQKGFALSVLIILLVWLALSYYFFVKIVNIESIETTNKPECL